MIAEDLLERGLATAADDYDVPEGAAARVRAELAPRPAGGAASAAHRRFVPQRRATWVVAAAAVVVVLAGVAFGVGGTGGTGGTVAPAAAKSAGGSFAGRTPVPTTPEHLQAQTSAGSFAAAGMPGSAAAPLLPATPNVVPHDNLSKVVKTGEMDLQAGKGQVDHTLFRLTAIAGLEGGYVADSQTSEGTDPSGMVTMRVPVRAFDATVNQVRALGVKVVSVQTKGTDVTSSYVDLQARIHALQATRTTYLRILARASSIGDILAVQSRVNDVQTQLEQLQGQLAVLSDQTSYGTLTVTVDQKQAPTPVAHKASGMSRALHRSVDRFVRGVEAIVGGIGPVLLALILVALAWVAARFGYRVLRRRMV